MPIRVSAPLGRSGPRRALGPGLALLVGVGLARLAGLVRRGGVVSRRELVHLVVDCRVRRAHADHEDRARTVTSADEYVVRARRAVQVVPLAHRPLLALYQRDALA